MSHIVRIVSFRENVMSRNLLYYVTAKLRYDSLPSPSHPVMMIRCAYSCYKFVICWIVDVMGARAYQMPLSLYFLSFFLPLSLLVGRSMFYEGLSFSHGPSCRMAYKEGKKENSFILIRNSSFVQMKFLDNHSPSSFWYM
jgi:hypothetical protein